MNASHGPDGVNTPADKGTPLMDENQWRKLTLIFDQLLEGVDCETALAAEPDPDVRDAALRLWRHHDRANREGYLNEPAEFAVGPAFQDGQVLLNRFRIERMLGRGGMGEVYLAWDERVEDRVAIKTIARLLAPLHSIRRRFIAEVQNARRVTHYNVCRIHELFEEGEVVFFSMEYVEGAVLSDMLGQPLRAPIARTIVKQMAEGLRAAHRIGVVHGDFKPANVMVTSGEDEIAGRVVIMDFGLAQALDRAAMRPEADLSVRAGTADYMAPELKDGRPVTIRSDIFAFGVVARALFPTERIWGECTRPRPEDRPATLDRIVRYLEPGPSRRYWLLAGAISVGATSYGIWHSSHSRVYIPTDARILVNGFRSVAGAVGGARLSRSLLLTALEQSTRIHAIADQDLLPMLRRIQPAAKLPLAGRALNEVLTLLRATFWIEGDLGQAGGRYSLSLRLLASSSRNVITAAVFRDIPGILQLAQAAAQWIRKAAGESERSLAINPVDVSSYTSEIPEALQKYYDAMDYYAAGEMDLATALFEEAVRLDPQFAQAHNMLARTVNAAGRYEEGFRENDLANRLAAKLPERERTAIESNYYRMTQDAPRMIAAARQNLVYHPDEPRSYAMLAERLSDSGNLAEAVTRCRQAVDLAPNDWMLILLLECTLVENGQFAEALHEFQLAAARNTTDPWLLNGAGYAYMGLEQYDDALRVFAKEPPEFDLCGDIPGANLLSGNLDSAIAAMEQRRAGANNPIAAHYVNDFLCGLYFVSDQINSARLRVREMANLSPYPPHARYLGCTASWARRLGEDETLAKVASIASDIARKWPNPHTAALEAHTMGLIAWRRDDTKTTEFQLQQSVGLAFGIWNLFDLAEFYTRKGKWGSAEESWNTFESRRGTLLYRRWFPGLLVMGWLYRAVAAQGRDDKAAAFSYSQKVLDHWSSANARLQIVQAARNINIVSKPF